LVSFASANVKRVVAESAGIKVGDTVLRLGEDQLAGARDLRSALTKFKFGQEFTCFVKRADAELTLSGKYPEFVSRMNM